jgi:DNA-binding PadR family transcriptional regulator
MIKQLLLLGLLFDVEQHGYQLCEYVAHAMSPFAVLKNPTIYFTLDKLEKEGFVRARVERQGNRPERRVYGITADGKARFLELLKKYLGEYTSPNLLDDIGVGFMERLPAAEVRELIALKRETVKATLARLNDLPAHHGNWNYVTAHHVLHLEADLLWLDRLITDLDSRISETKLYSTGKRGKGKRRIRDGEQ